MLVPTLPIAATTSFRMTRWSLSLAPCFAYSESSNNRHIENLFKDFSSRKFFLGRDNIREVLMVR